MNRFIDFFFGHGNELDSLQMACRAVLIFCIALAFVRIAGIRTFGKHSAFDNVVIIMLGAVLSRAVVGSSPFIPTCAAGLAFVIIHRILAILSFRSDKFGKLVKGEPSVLFSDGVLEKENMKRTHISEKDLYEGIRLAVNRNDLEGIRKILIERNGKISVIKKA